MRYVTYRFTFDRSVPMDEVAGTLRLAALAAEALHGEAQVALDARHHLDRRRRLCVIEATTPAGRDMAKLFERFISREFGTSACRVERVESQRARSA